MLPGPTANNVDAVLHKGCCVHIMMLKLVMLSLAWLGEGRKIETSLLKAQDAALLPPKPKIDRCRSADMETFTCWWSTADDGTGDSRNNNYTLTYTVGFEPKRECPDYITGGNNSCYFDSDHTQVWVVYCLNVTAWNKHGSQTSDERCLDVVDIVEPDPPTNMTYSFTNSSHDGHGQTVLVSWLAPETVDVDSWLTLVYELQFRRKSENHWKVKGILRESKIELLDFPEGSYIVRVRCKSKNSGHWSKWSKPMTLNISLDKSIDMMLALILVTGVSIMAFLIIGFGILPQRKRIKAFLLPPIPKPRISGIDPLLLKRGKMDEINRLFTSIYGYIPSQSAEESWLEVSMDGSVSSKDSLAEADGKPRSTQCPIDLVKKVVETKEEQEERMYILGLDRSQPSLKESMNPNENVAWSSENKINVEKSFEAITSPGRGYSVALSPATGPGSHDFYTCVNRVSCTGAVQLTPCLTDCGHKSTFLELKGTTGKPKHQNSTTCSPKSTASLPDVKGGFNEQGDCGNLSYTTVEALHLHQDAAPVTREEEAECPFGFSRNNEYLCLDHNVPTTPLLTCPISEK
ncbi:growth hormone receptor-like isoform X1 [Acipenser oxyrinchus oxyrinchus]|uniref:Growth hormone receptor-like isoform X1 n=1 Tax=Acipenser oxyrinchus oxyrinchus TaxID=40147 RepID=A0AAD8LM18_ACIOX|nr:growth hormone receptor-like isoform X1 [Acipenser oxyrinchus oxyrinchus]